MKFRIEWVQVGRDRVSGSREVDVESLLKAEVEAVKIISSYLMSQLIELDIKFSTEHNTWVYNILVGGYRPVGMVKIELIPERKEQ